MKTRGFITLATGSQKYYELARNLLMSYRLYTNNPLPFAIMCEEQNEYTALFDQIVILENPLRSFWDKFQLLVKAPYDETIFIDSDCLAYGDLNEYFDYFSKADDFTGCGTNYPIDSEKGIFTAQALEQAGGGAPWKPDIHGGLYYIRRGATCEALYQKCQWIAEHYDEFQWPDYCAPKADETVLCLAMATMGLRAIDARPMNYGIPWEALHMKLDIFTGKCQYDTEWHPMVEHGMMIHFSVRYCVKPTYLFEVEKLELMLKNGFRPSTQRLPLNWRDTLMYQWKLRFGYLCLKDFSQRAWRKLLRILGLAPAND